MKPAAIDPPEITAALWDGVAGTVGWDIGANCGQTLGEMTGRFRTVHAFEPATECQPWLTRWSDDWDVHVHQCAVSDTAGTIELIALPDKIDTGQLVTAGTCGMEWNPDSPNAVIRSVPAATVDDLTQQLEPADFLKIDVEGHEMRVLDGASNTLHGFKPGLLIEFHSPELHTQALECLTRHGYRNVTTIRHPHYAPNGPMWHQHGWIRAHHR